MPEVPGEALVTAFREAWESTTGNDEVDQLLRMSLLASARGVAELRDLVAELTTKTH